MLSEVEEELINKLINLIIKINAHVHNRLKVYLASITLRLFQFDFGANIFKLQAAKKKKKKKKNDSASLA